MKKGGKAQAFSSGFDEPVASEDPWVFESTGSASLDKIVKDYARPKPVETRMRRVDGREVVEVLRSAVNQEPCEEERRVQHARGVRWDDCRAAAIEARKAVSLGRTPFTRDEVAECVAQAFRFCYATSIEIGKNGGPDDRPFTKDELSALARSVRDKSVSAGLGRTQVPTVGAALMEALGKLPVAREEAR